jgi:hypothetical protein
MTGLPSLSSFLRIDASTRLMRGFGNTGGHMHRASGIEFAGKLVALGLGAIVVFVICTMAAPSVSKWVRQRYDVPDVTQSPGWGVFLIVAFVLALGLILVLARFL